jgi:ubiquinol-cytochrome c reductase cytochrome c subunit
MNQTSTPSRTRQSIWAKRLALPFSILAIALGLAFVGGDASANESTPKESASSEPAHANLPTAATDPPRAPVGSGGDNVYSQESLRAVPEGTDAGRQLYVQGCATCHGASGEGTDIAPSIRGAGAAAVDFYVGTGRMPLDNPMAQAPRRDPVYSQEQIDALGEYVATLGEGPPIPDVDPEAGNLVEGNQLYANNCASCHNSSGAGGSLGRDYYAPNLYDATPVEIAEAMRIGPGAMPEFGPGVFTEDQVNSITRYVVHLQDEESYGGLSIGRLGPFSEGFVAWIVGIGSMLGIARWIGTRE